MAYGGPGCLVVASVDDNAMGVVQAVQAVSTQPPSARATEVLPRHADADPQIPPRAGCQDQVVDGLHPDDFGRYTLWPAKEEVGGCLPRRAGRIHHDHDWYEVVVAMCAMARALNAQGKVRVRFVALHRDGEFYRTSSVPTTDWVSVTDLRPARHRRPSTGGSLCSSRSPDLFDTQGQDARVGPSVSWSRYNRSSRHSWFPPRRRR